MGLHLWYLEMLFLFSLLALPLFLWLKGVHGQLFSGLVASVLEKPGAILGLGTPVVLLGAFLAPDGPGLRDFGGWDLFAYFWLFLCGYLLASQPGIEGAVRRHGYLGLGLATIIIIALAATVTPGVVPKYGTLEYQLVMGSRGLASWCGIIGFFALAHRFFSFNNRFLRYANEAVLPFYILHQPIILLVGLSLKDWPINVWLKYPVLGVISFVIIIAIYELLVRRMPALRFVFGLKATRRPT
jgi:glucans biosynthesis protein C